MSELNSYDSDHMAHTVENIYSLALYRKCLLTPPVYHQLHEGWDHDLTFFLYSKIVPKM